MSLDVAKLEKVRELDGGMVQARCPACAEGGNDRTGEHLRIYPDGKFGCCVHPKDRDHRKKIWALVGVRKAGTFTLRLTAPSAAPAAQSVKAVLDIRTSRTGETNSNTRVPMNTTTPMDESRTARTHSFNTRAYTRDNSIVGNTSIDSQCKLKELEQPVRDVLLELSPSIAPESKSPLPDLQPPVPSVPTPGGRPPSIAEEKLPFLTAGGDLSIPFDSPERYHWWRGGQSVETTLAEVRAALASQKG